MQNGKADAYIEQAYHFPIRPIKSPCEGQGIGHRGKPKGHSGIGNEGPDHGTVTLIR